MGYIFTEYFFDIYKNYIYLNTIVLAFINLFFSYLSHILPYIVKYLIGYCNFYYQLGYGLIFYIYIYRRRSAKISKNWNTFYGNSVANWLLFNISLFNKFIFNKSFLIYIKTFFIKNINILGFWLNNYINNSVNIKKIGFLTTYIKKFLLFNNWTPLFKRTSYISFFTFLKRFSKRK